MQKVSIGRIVHIKGRNQPYAAIVTDVDERTGLIDAVIFAGRGTTLAAFPTLSGNAGFFAQVSPVQFSGTHLRQGGEWGEWSFPPIIGRIGEPKPAGGKKAAA